MNTTLTLTKASLVMFLRNRQALFFSLFFPLVIMVIFGLIGFDKPPQFDVGIVTGHPQPATSQMVNQIKTVSVFKIHEGTKDDELKALDDGSRVVVLQIPDDFVTTAPGSPAKTMTVWTNEGQAAQAQAVVSILSTFLDKTTLALAHAPTLFTLNEQVVNSKNLRYIDFLLPGLIAMSVMQMSVFSVAFVFVQYKEKGVLKRLLATPMQPGQFVAANVITRLSVSVLQAAIFLAIGVLFLHAHVLGSYLLVTLCVVLGSLMFLGLGFAVSGLSMTVDSVPALANLFVFPQLFLGGVFFSIDNMPHWLQVVSKLLPLTHFANAIRDVMTKGAGFGAIGWDILIMAIWAAVLIAIATVTFSFQEKDN